MKEESYGSIDLMKFIASIFVVMIHTNPFVDVDMTLQWIVCDGIARLSVPLFFITSSFFLFRKEKYSVLGNKENVLYYCKRIGKLYISWFVLSIPIIIYERFILTPYSFGIDIFRFIRGFFLSSTFGGSWFLTSCVFCAFLFYFIDRLPSKINIYLIFFLSILGYILCVLSSSYRGLFINIPSFQKVYSIYEMFFCNPYTSIIAGIPYFAIGRSISHSYDRLNVKPFFNFLPILSVLYLCEVYFVNSSGLAVVNNTCFLTLPCSVCLFVVISKYRISISHSLFLRMSSTIIFFSQFIWIFLLYAAQKILGFELFSLFRFLIVLTLCFLTSFIMITLSKTHRTFKFFF